MPELPEVEAARRAVEEHCLGKKIVSSIVADDSKVIDGVSTVDFQASLHGKTIVAAHRKGKNMWIQLDSPPFPSFQFGMSGAIYIKGVAVTKYKRSAVSDTDEWPSKYSKLFLKLDDGLELSFTDKRRFARVRLLKDPAVVPPISELGPDALSEPMTLNEFVESLSKKKLAIKALLLDQSYIAGIGNWIADEVLYQARIHPLQPASSLSKGSCESLHKCIKEVIEKAVEVGADSSQFPENWIFHSREKKPGKAFVDGKKIEFITAGGRTTAYVPELQKLPDDQARKELAKSTKHSHGEDEEEESEEEETSKEKKSKKGNKKATGIARAPSSKKKSKGRRDRDDVGDGEQPKKRTKVTANKQSKEVTEKSKTKTDTTKEKDDETDGEQAKKNTRATANKQSKVVEEKSKTKTDTTQKGKSKKRK